MKRALGLAMVVAFLLPGVSGATEEGLCLRVDPGIASLDTTETVALGFERGWIEVLEVVPCDEAGAVLVEATVDEETGDIPLGFSPINLKGKGDKVARFDIPEDSAAIATFGHKGRANFVVTSIADDGSSNDLLVNEIGKYEGTVLFDGNTHSAAFRIEADGNWTATIEPLLAARGWDTSGSVSGKGDDVLLLSPPTSGLATTRLTNKGSSNFIVTVYTTDGSGDLLVNEIGNYDGEVLLPDASLLMTVQGYGGSWSASAPE